MPTNVLPITPTLTVIFRGLLITCIQEVEPLACIGVLGTSACHLPKLGITKTTADGEDHAIRPLSPLNSLDEQISLQVEKTSRPGIRILQIDPFNRTNPLSHENDFRWYIDLDEIHQPPLATTDTMKPIMSMNEGLFYTYTRSPGGVKLRRGGQPEEFGFFGLEIAANIYLDQDDSKASLLIGDAEILTARKADNAIYTMLLDCECITASNVSDFPLIYQMVASDLPANEKVDFEGDPQLTGPGLTPEVYCSGVNLGKSKFK